MGSASEQLFTGKRGKPHKIKEKRFNESRDLLKKKLVESNYLSRTTAEQDLEDHIRQMDPITFFFFRTIIGWLIAKLLDSYFSKEDDQD